MNKSIVSFIVIAGFKLSSYAATTNMCREFYVFNRTWLASQAAKVREYVKKSSQEKAIEEILLKTSQNPRDLETPLETDQFIIQVIDQGLGVHTPVEVVMTDKATRQQHVLLSSLKLEKLRLTESEKRDVYAPTVARYLNNNTVLPVGVQLSPLRDILLVKVSAAGSIDGHTLVVIDLKTKQIVQEIENSASSDAVWITPTQFVFQRHQVGDRAYMATVNKNNVKVEPSNLAWIRASDDQQWYYFMTSSGKIMIISTVSGQKIQLPNIDIVDVLSNEAGDGNIWIRANGFHGFREIIKITTSLGVVTSRKIVPEDNTIIDKTVSVTKEYVQYQSYLGADRWINFVSHDGVPLAKVKAPDCCAISRATYNAVNQTVDVVLQSPIVNKTNWAYDLKTNSWLRNEANKLKIVADPGKEMMIANGQAFITKYESFRSKDGTVIPIRVTYKEGTELNREAPTLMEGYGGFALNNYFHPAYERMVFEFLNSGGVHLAPALRGSYFFGEEWHKQGRGLNKQKVVDDFVGAAEWAIAKGITVPKRLAISGASHGGLVVGAAITQRPELFGLAFPQYGPHAFHDKPALDPISTPRQKLEYGDLMGDLAAQKNALNISPVNRTIPQDYPMTVVITGRRDSRVNPVHSYRFFDVLQQNQTGDQPIMLYTQNNSGHWMSSIPRQDFLGWRARTVFWSVLFKYMKMDISSH